jgi:hypothetical protein
VRWMWFLVGPIVPALLLHFELRFMLELLELWLLDRTVLRLPEGRAILRRSSGRGCSRGTGDHAGSGCSGQGSVSLVVFDEQQRAGPLRVRPGSVFLPTRRL